MKDEVNNDHEVEKEVKEGEKGETEGEKEETEGEKEETEEEKETHKDNTKTHSREDKPFKGLIFGVLGSILFALTSTCFRKLSSHDYMTITHLFTLMLIVFIPAFFPMQGVAKPAYYDWIIMVVLSLFCYIGLLCFIKSCQEQNGTGKVLSVFSLLLIGVVLAEIFTGVGGFGNHFWGIVGSICIVVTTVGLV